MITASNNWKLAEAFVTGALTGAELAALNSRLEQDPVFAADFTECVNLIRSLENSSKQKNFRKMLVSIHRGQMQPVKPSWKVRTIPLRTHYIRTAAIAAGIAILTTLSTFSIISHNEKKRSSQYSLLKRDIETVKRSQKVIIQNINARNNIPAAPARYSGTGFALSNDGYLVTNYHVTEDADSIYIQNREGSYFKAHLISFDAKNDVAILKVDHKNFRFGKTEIPYTFAAAKKALGAKVFTLGFPEDEIVYNQGYISAKNGYQGDTMQYRLELPANPGQSGAPVVDENGNIIGIITGKGAETSGTTYAISTGALHKLIHSLPQEVKIRLGKVNKLSKLPREQQVEKLEFYTCAVKVYKK